MRSKTISFIHPFFLIAVFLITCFVTGRFFYHFWGESQFVQIDSSNADWANVLVFTPDNAEVIAFGNLSKYLENRSEYSFTVPTDNREFYQKKLIENFRKSNLKRQANFESEQISDNRQSIQLRIAGSRRDLLSRYDATEKEVFLKSFRNKTLITEVPFLLIVTIIGVLFVLAANISLRKVLITNELR